MPNAVLSVLLVAFAANVAAWGWAAVGWRRMMDALEADGLTPRDPDDEDAPREDAPREDAPPVLFSVVVAAHDEAARLPRLLAALRRQTHRLADGTPAFEVVVVDDRSADGTAAFARKTAAAWTAAGGPDLRIVRVVRVEDDAGDPTPPKKRALAAGIAEARHDRLALTDADTDPPATWLETLARFAAPDGQDDGAVLIGFGPYVRRPGWINRFVRYETLQTAALAAAGIGWDRPWQAVGRNLSYPKALFERLGGFTAPPGRARGRLPLSGDDDLFVQHVARERAAHVRYVADARAFVPSGAPDSWSAFWRQRRRHASAGAHYAPSVLAGLGVLHVSALVLWLGAPLYHLWSGAPTGWGLLALHLLVQRAAIGPAIEALGVDGDVRLAQPLLDGLSTLYQAAAAVLGLLPAPRRW